MQWLEVTIRTVSCGVELLCAELSEAGFDSLMIDDDEEFDRVADLFEDNLFDEVDYDGEEK